MAKDDIATKTLLAWDKYKDKPVDEALPSIYEHASGKSNKTCGWYWASIKNKRRASLFFRFITFGLVILGTLLPILAGLMTKPEIRLQFTQWGVAALALGGLLQVADRVFGWSSGWLRYITTVTAMENLTRKFEMDWAGYVLSKTTALEKADVKKLFEVAKQFVDGISKMQSEETDKWVTEFNSGMALMGDLIKSQKKAGEEALKKVQTTLTAQKTAAQVAQETGAVELTLVHKAAAKPVKIAIDEKDPIEFTGTVWSKVGVPAGQHTLRVVVVGPTPNTITKVIKVPPGDVAQEQVKLT